MPVPVAGADVDAGAAGDRKEPPPAAELPSILVSPIC